MKVTKIEEQKNKKRLNIYIDGEYHSSIDKDILEEISLYEGMELNSDEFNQKMEIIQYKSALRAALYMLTRSSKTENEIKKKLKEKLHSENAIRKVLEYLMGIGYVNDESYTESFIKSMSDTTGTSSRSLYYKLVSKGVDKDIIERKLEEAEIDDYSSALKAAQKKAIGLKGDKRKKVSKLLNFLYRKGFGMEVCQRVLATLDLDDVEN